MARNISSNALAAIANRFGEEPINILQVSWNEGTSIQYADKDVNGIQGRIIKISNFDEAINLDQTGNSASINVVLDDSDGSLRNIFNNYDIHKRPCTLYQYFEGLDPSDAFPIFIGQIASPIVWDEGQRTLSFDILSKIHSREVGFSPEQGQFANIPPDLVGKVWPLCFGTPVHVPCTRSNETLTGATLTLFGLPDVTLQAKRRLIEIGIESLTNTYDFYNVLINQANNMVDPAEDLQDGYVDLILEEDRLKQAREDTMEFVENLNKQMETVRSEYDDAEGNKDDINTEKGQIYAKLQKIQQSRDMYVDDLRSYSAALNDIEYDKKLSDRDFKYSKYTFNIVGRLRKKIGNLLSEYYDLQQKLRSLDIILNDQIALMSNKVIVSNGYRFPQNTLTSIEIDSQYFLGTFNGNVFTFAAAAPTYTDVFIGPKKDTELNTFYIANGNLKLSGKYCLLSDGNIIKVTGQSGNKCTFELRQKPDDDLRLKKNEISSLGSNIASARSALSHILTGNETDEEIVTIMNQIPQSISNEVIKKLNGGIAMKQVITMEHVTGGKFKLYCDEFESPDILYSADAATIKAAIMTFPNIIAKNSIALSKDQGPHITVTGGPLPNSDITIEFSEFMLPMPQIRADGSDLTGAKRVQKLRTQGGSDGYKFWLKTDSGDPSDEDVVYIPYDASANAVKALLEKSPAYKSGDISTAGGPLNVAPVIIQFDNANVHTIDASSGTMTKTGDFTDDDGTSVKLSRPATLDGASQQVVGCYVKSEGAHEYTVGEIEKMIEDAIGKTQYKKTLEDIKKKLKALFNAQENQKEEFNFVADDAESFKEILQYTQQYKTIMKSIEIPQSILTEAYRLISDHEYQVLLNYEILNYMQWRRQITPLTEQIPDESTKYYVTGYDIIHIREVSGTVLPQWVPNLLNGDTETIVNNVQRLPTTQAYVAQVGSKVTLAGNYQEKYVANILPSTVHAVYAYRSIDGVRYLVPLPTRYYVKNENENFGGMNITTITLVRPLSEYTNENWQDGIYVTLTSSKGPNTADIIKWIAQTYTTLDIDTASFADVATKIANYPSHFALFQIYNATQLMQEIAWQARCAVYVKLNKLYIKYLAEEPTAIDTVDEDDIDFETLQVTTTPTEDLVTKLTATWKPAYDLDEYKIVLRSNITKYDVVTQEFNFFIYNIYELVLKSATFWLIRRANTWKRVSFTVPLNKLNLETYDTITLSLSNNLICTGSSKALIESADYDSESQTITLKCWLPILFGSMTPSSFAWPANISVQLLFPTNEVIITGNAGNPIGDKVPSGLSFDPTSTSALAIRPNDYGDLVPSDLDDAMPPNPANEVAEIDYSNVDISNFEAPTFKNLTDKDKNETDEPVRRPESEHQPGAVKQALGRGSTGASIGIIEELDHIDTITDVKDGDEETEIVRQYYKVRLNDGREVVAEQIQIHKDSRLPAGVAAYVVYNDKSQQYEMQVPVWIGEENV